MPPASVTPAFSSADFQFGFGIFPFIAAHVIRAVFFVVHVGHGIVVLFTSLFPAPEFVLSARPVKNIQAGPAVPAQQILKAD